MHQALRTGRHPHQSQDDDSSRLPGRHRRPQNHRRHCLWFVGPRGEKLPVLDLGVVVDMTGLLGPAPTPTEGVESAVRDIEDVTEDVPAGDAAGDAAEGAVDTASDAVDAVGDAAADVAAQ